MNPKTDLDVFLRPTSIAIIGASPKGGFATRVLKVLTQAGYTGRIFPVNPKYSNVLGWETFPSLLAIPHEVDLALIATSAGTVESIVKECAQKAVKGALIFSSGFGETGHAGKEMETRIAESCRTSGLRVIGPNSYGVMNFGDNVVYTASTIMDRIIPDRESSIALVAQSGGLGPLLLAEADRRGIGIRCFVSIGNQADVSICEVASHLLDDPAVKVVGMYIEALQEGAGLLALAEKAIILNKSIVVLKSGRTKTGGRAAASHTGAVVGNDMIYDAVFRQHGLTRVADMEEMLGLMWTVSTGRTPKGNRVGMITLSGGVGVMMADLCEESGLELPQLSTEGRMKVASLFPEFSTSTNPLDLTAEINTRPELLGQALDILVDDVNIDAVIIFFGLNDLLAPRILADIKDVYARTKKPVFIHWWAPSAETLEQIKKSSIPYFPDPTRAVRAMRLMVSYKKLKDNGHSWQQRGQSNTSLPRMEKVHHYLKQIREKGRSSLSEYEARWVLERYDIPLVKGRLVNSPAEAGNAAESIGFPVVMKIESPDILHKSNAMCVLLDIRSRKEAEEAYETIITNAKRYNQDAIIKGVLIEEMLRDARELVIGSKNDNVFGPVITFGLGGIFVEVLRDVACRSTPVSFWDAREMIFEIKGINVLRGFRGKQPVNIEALAELLVRFSEMVYELKDMVIEVDVNPLLVSADGNSFFAADALMTIKPDLLEE